MAVINYSVGLLIKLGPQHVFDHHLQEADWFLKADDDTFVIVENLKNLLQHHNTNAPVYFGHNFKYLGGYMAGLHITLSVLRLCQLCSV